MKRVNRLVVCLVCLAGIGVSACSSVTDEGPSQPAEIGTFTGDFTNQITGVQSQFAAETANAIQDTSLFDKKVTITATNAEGEIITIVLSDTSETMYQITPTSFNLTTFITATDTATSQSDDQDANLQSSVQITGNGKSDNMLTGESSSLSWVLVNPADEDQAYGEMQNVTFSVPLTRTGDDGGSGADVNVSATVDGSDFGATSIYSTMLSGGFLIVAGSSVASLTINIPEGATVGDHDLSSFQNGYSIYYTPNDENAYISVSGNMNIAAIDTDNETVSGTFNCVASNPSNPGTTVNITNGIFSVE